MDNLKPNIFVRSLSAGSLCMLIFPILLNLMTSGEKLSYIPMPVVFIFLVAIIPYHAHIISYHSFNQSIKVSILSGLFLGTIFSLAGRISLVLNYFIISPDKNFKAASVLFIDSWWFYLYAALLGAICMSIKPLRSILRGQSFKNEKETKANKIIYTYLDKFQVLHHSNIDVDSVDEAKERLSEKFDECVVVDYWKTSENITTKPSSWPTLDTFWMQMSNSKRLVYFSPSVNIIFRTLSTLMLIPMIFIEHSLPLSLMCVLFVSVTFVHSTKIVISHNGILYNKRFLFRTEEKRLGILNATKVLFKGVKFESFAGESRSFYFVCLEKDGQEITIFGHPCSTMTSTRKIANRIGSFLKLPVEEYSNQRQ